MGPKTNGLIFFLQARPKTKKTQSEYQWQLGVRSESNLEAANWKIKSQIPMSKKPNTDWKLLIDRKPIFIIYFCCLHVIVRFRKVKTDVGWRHFILRDLERSRQMWVGDTLFWEISYRDVLGEYGFVHWWIEL